jgi:hypothetical protein
MFYNHTFMNTKPKYKQYIWNYKDHKYLFTGFKGLAYQDKKGFPSTIQT